MIRSLFAAALILAAPAAAQRGARTAAVGQHIDWSAERDPRPVTYRAGGFTLAMRPQTGEGESSDMQHLSLTVSMPGMAPVTVDGNDTSPRYEHRVTVADWDAHRRYVLFQSFSGGAHCCTSIKAIVPEGGALHVFDLGEHDGDYLDALPRDIDGDGTIDFVFRDGAFLYAFSSYAESYPPPQVWNIVDGRLVDVSSRPGFRPLFEEAIRDARNLCLHPEGDINPNGVCAGYVAMAARLGRFDAAWAEMLRAYRRDVDWDLPPGCRRVMPENEACPDADQIRYPDYPEALRHFLIDLHYIER